MGYKIHPFSAPFSPSEAKNRVQNAIILAGFTMLLAYPTVLYRYSAAADLIFSRTPTDGQLQLLALGQSIVIFGLASVCSLVGFLYSDRLSLPGLGRAGSLPPWLGIGLAAGLVLAYPSWWISDRWILQTAPGMEPSPWHVSLARMAGESLTQEVIARFGLLTIGVYLLRRFEITDSNLPAIFAVSGFAAVGAAVSTGRLGLELSGLQMALAVLLSFARNWILAEVFLRRGLIASVGLHAGLNLKLLLYSFILSPN